VSNILNTAINTHHTRLHAVVTDSSEWMNYINILQLGYTDFPKT